MQSQIINREIAQESSYENASTERAQANPEISFMGELVGAFFLVWIIKRITLKFINKGKENPKTNLAFKHYFIFFICLGVAYQLLHNSYDGYLNYGLSIFVHYCYDIYQIGKLKLKQTLNSNSPEERLKKIDEMFEKGLISESERNIKRQSIIEKI